MLVRWRPLLGRYETFFAASAGASAAILGLLVVAVSVVNADDDDAKFDPEWVKPDGKTCRFNPWPYPIA